MPTMASANHPARSRCEPAKIIAARDAIAVDYDGKPNEVKAMVTYHLNPR